MVWKMINKGKKAKRILAALLMVTALAGMSPAGKVDVRAMEQDAVDSDTFEIDAKVAGADENTYNISVSVENQGADWEGIVRVVADEDYLVPTAYDTVLTLPQGSEKQFVVKIPKGASDASGSGSVKIQVLDKKSKVLETRTFSKLLLEQMECLSMGILSDDYSALTYLDMGGNTIYYKSGQFPIKLEELKQDNLVDALDALTILVIDKYNTDILTDDELAAVMQWVNDGGVLIVGTGTYAEDVWSGLADCIPEVQILDTIGSGDGYAGNGTYGSQEIDISQLTLAQLYTTNSTFYESYFSHGLSSPVGDGAVGILPYSLVELGEAGNSIYVDYYAREDYVFNVVDEMTSAANARYNNTNYAMNSYDQMYTMRSMLGIMGNSGSRLSFGVLKFIVILYVIFVGPILYLILRAAKKREWYWLTVPVTAFLGIIIIFFAGRGFEVVSTKVYSVTAQDVDARKQTKTFMYCYDAEFKEWNLRLAEGYDYVGPMMNQNYNYIGSTNNDVYYHRMQNEGGNFSFGIKPSKAFEDCFFYAGKDAGSDQDPGSIDCAQISADWGSSVRGEITNNTDKDFLFFVVDIGDTFYVYENLPAGGSCSLGYQAPIYYTSQSNNMRNSYFYDFLRLEYDNRDAEEIAALAALGVGLMEVTPQSGTDDIVVCGVTADWANAVDDDCSEVSYGCLYTIQ